MKHTVGEQNQTKLCEPDGVECITHTNQTTRVSAVWVSDLSEF